MLSNNNNGTATGSGSTVENAGSGNGVEAGVDAANGPMGLKTLRDVCNFLESSMHPRTLAPGDCPYDHIIDMIRGLDLQDDGILMNRKIKSIETDFCMIVRDENMLCESMEYINDKALGDGETALKFAMLFSSRNFDVLAMKETKVRSAMLKILETNFLNADTYRAQDRTRLYNSITLLGEYYHRVRLADNSPITILGESLLGQLIREVSEPQQVIDVRLAKLVLSQVTLNGDLMRAKHKVELTQLLFHLRRHLIEQPALKPTVKALLLMTIDLYYSNFRNLGAELEAMYTKYLIQEDEDEGNNNSERLQQQQTPIVAYQSPQPQTEAPNFADKRVDSYENGGSGTAVDNSFDSEVCTKKWSEQVCEENEYEEECRYGSELNMSAAGSTGASAQERLHGSFSEQRGHNRKRQDHNDHRQENSISGDVWGKGARGGQRATRNTPRPLKSTFNSKPSSDTNQQLPQSQTAAVGTGSFEERDQSKPLPRWRAPRFNRDASSEQQRQQEPEEHGRNHRRRFSASYDDDRQSVRSEGGSAAGLRLYSVGDRLKYSQEKIERNSGPGGNYKSLANSNWDRHSQRDDRSERSYVSNYERGNHKRGGRHYNSRQNYDKPPRFQKHQQQQQQQYKDNKDNKIHSDTWRRSSNYYQHQQQNGGVDESRAHTLPRPGKTNFERRSQSPGQYQQQHQQQHTRRYHAGRYSSQSSLASASEETGQQHQHPHQHQQQQQQQRRNRSYGRHRQHQHTNHEQDQQQHQNEDWNAASAGVVKVPTEDHSSDLVREARETRKYMDYLASKK